MSEPLHSTDYDAGRGGRKKGYWPDGKSVIPGLPDLAEKDAVCRWCSFTDADCRASRSGGYIKCCPDCDHRALPPEGGTP